jgi:hypothetical protein
MKDEALKLAIGKIKSARDCHFAAIDPLLFEAEEILEQALAAQQEHEPENEPFVSLASVQEPVATNKIYVTREQLAELYPPPAAQRQWVGLTDEQIWLEYQRFWPFHPAEEPTLAKDIAKFARAIEAKLRSKNI